MDLKSMEAGNAFDALIAARVMGTSLLDPHEVGHGYIMLPGDRPTRFAPTRFIEDAWLAVLEMEERGYEWEARYEGGADPKTAYHVVGFGWGTQAMAPTLPLAICRAIMEALENEDVSDVKAGPDLDREVAEKFLRRKVALSRDLDLGWKEALGAVPSAFPPECVVRNLTGAEWMMEVDGKWVPIPPYSTVMAAAWEIAEEDGEYELKCFYTEMRGEPGAERRYLCDFYEAQASAEARTAPLAICLTALKCMGTLPRKERKKGV